MTKHNIANDLDTPGKRFMYIRGLTRLGRSQVEHKYGISNFTLYNWETGRNKVTEKVLKSEECQNFFTSENLDVDINWVLTGDGRLPRKIFTSVLLDTIESTLNIGDIPEEIIAQKEIKQFARYNSNPICIQVDSDDMNPFFSKGDFVCGSSITDKEKMKAAVGYDCIVSLLDGRNILRRVAAMHPDGKCDLICHNPKQGTKDSQLLNIEITALAPVKFHRLFPSC